VNKDKDDTIGNINVINSSETSATALQRTSDIGNDKEIDIEKEKEGKNLTVKVCMDLDVELIGKAFVSSDMMVVDSKQNVHDETVKSTKKMKPKKQTRKSGKVDESNDKLLMKVH